MLEDAEIIYVVMPFCGGGDLFGAVEARVTAGLSAMGEPSAFRYASQIAEGLSAMHALGLAHHDVSAARASVRARARARARDARERRAPGMRLRPPRFARARLVASRADR